MAELTLVFHRPGPAWEDSADYGSQHGIDAHVEYWRSRLDEGLLWLGGPFPDGSGGMMVLKCALEAGRFVASADPAVRSSLLLADAKPWRLVLAGGMDGVGDGR